eukprot:2582802-Pyramimonas_sp.AAC.1
MLCYGPSGAVAYTTQKPKPEFTVYAQARGAVGGLVEERGEKREWVRKDDEGGGARGGGRGG